MSPGQTQAYLSLAADERRAELGEMLAIQALAAGSRLRTKEDADLITKQITQLSGEG